MWTKLSSFSPPLPSPTLTHGPFSSVSPTLFIKWAGKVACQDYTRDQAWTLLHIQCTERDPVYWKSRGKQSFSAQRPKQITFGAFFLHRAQTVRFTWHPPAVIPSPSCSHLWWSWWQKASSVNTKAEVSGGRLVSQRWRLWECRVPRKAAVLMVLLTINEQRAAALK